MANGEKKKKKGQRESTENKALRRTKIERKKDRKMGNANR